MRYTGDLHKVATSRLMRDAATLLRNMMTTGAPFAAELERRARLLTQEARDARERCAGGFHRVGCSCDVLERIGERPAR